VARGRVAWTPIHALVAAALATTFAPAPIGAQAPGAAAQAGMTPPAPAKREFPTYPRGAQKRGIEGFVVIEFTVDERGDVVAPRVIEASPPGVFDSAALEAITSWKYKPAMIGQTAIAAPNQRVKLDFKIE
jgi:protein TonB